MIRLIVRLTHTGAAAAGVQRQADEEWLTFDVDVPALDALFEQASNISKHMVVEVVGAERRIDADS